MNPHIRWAIRRDMPEVLAIDATSFTHGWDEFAFISRLRTSNVIGMVAECDNRIAGFMVYHLQKGYLYVERLAVHEDYRYTGVGTALIQKLIDKLNPDRRDRIEIHINERNLETQEFLKSRGFWATRTEKEYFEDTGRGVPDDAYVMEYRLASPVDLALAEL